MTTRRQVIAGSAGFLFLGAPPVGGESASSPSVARQALVALPGKKPLIKRSFRPPNFETPLSGLKGDFTANDEFFVRYHVADIPEVNPETWRLKVGGASAQRTIELSLADLARGFERFSVAAINQCSGNRRGLFVPRAGGIQWHHGAMGNAVWSGVRLRDVLNRAGIKEIRLKSYSTVRTGACCRRLPTSSRACPSIGHWMKTR
jgi:DMSO/TMAO reductase YedYZ molybdopterin-dependent catalytic subunit